MGLLQDTSKTIADSFLFFLAYNFLRQSRLRSRGSKDYLPVFDELSVGFVAGGFSKLLTTPIANIVTRIQTSSMIASRDDSGEASSRSATVSSIAQDIYSEKGVLGFWSGYSASLVLTLNPSLTFFFFETLKRTAIPKSKRSDPPALATFFIAAVSKAMASTITYPFSLAKARAQVSSKMAETSNYNSEKSESNDQENSLSRASKKDKAARLTVFSTILRIANTEGIHALYEGLSGEVLKGFFSHGITMITKDAVHKLIIQTYYVVLKLLKRYPSPQELAARAKEQAQATLSSIQGRAEEAGVQAQELAKDASRAAVHTLESTKEQVKSNVTAAASQASATMEELYTSGQEKTKGFLSDAHEIADLIADYVGEEAEDFGRAIKASKGGSGTGEQ